MILETSNMEEENKENKMETEDAVQGNELHLKYISIKNCYSM